MDIATANLFPDESDGSEDFKLVKVARECRASQMKNPKSGVLMIGMLHSRLTTANANRSCRRWSLACAARGAS